MNRVRTCLGCRHRVGVSALLRIVARDGEVLPDHSATLPGRGAWVHPVADCIEKATRRRAFGRALRVTRALNTSRLNAAIVVETGAGETGADTTDRIRSRIPNPKAD